MDRRAVEDCHLPLFEIVVEIHQFFDTNNSVALHCICVKDSLDQAEHFSVHSLCNEYGSQMHPISDVSTRPTDKTCRLLCNSCFKFVLLYQIKTQFNTENFMNL